MFAFGFGALLFPLFAVLMIVVAVRVIVLTVRVPPKASREPVCEVCRYRVAGLASFTCPECGTDLRRTGIITLPMEIRRRGSLAGAILAWIFLMLVVGSVGVSVIGMLAMAPVVTAAASGAMTTTTPLTPASGAYARVETVSSLNYGAGGTGGTADAALVLKDGSRWTLSYAPLGASYTVTGPDGAAKTTAPDDGKGVDALFAGAGLDLKDAKIGAEVRELSTVMGVLEASPWTSVNMIRMRAFTPGAPTTSGGPAAGTAVTGGVGWMLSALVVGLVWVALLIGGIVFIVVRRKRVIRQFGGAARPLPPEEPAPA